MMIALLTLGAESRDVSSTKTCFGDAVTNAVIAAPIKLELLTWSSQKLVTRVAEILMREKLGYLDVSRIRISATRVTNFWEDQVSSSSLIGAAMTAFVTASPKHVFVEDTSRDSAPRVSSAIIMVSLVAR